MLTQQELNYVSPGVHSRISIFGNKYIVCIEFNLELLVYIVAILNNKLSLVASYFDVSNEGPS
jgi:hypothetical protein